MIKPQEKFMCLAIEEAEKAQKANDYAIGAVIVKNDKVICSANSHTLRDEDPVAHAECVAIIEASKKLKSRHLKNCILYTTHEPCPMCAGAVVWAKMKGVVYGAKCEDMKEYSKKYGNEKYLWRTINMSCKEVLDKSNENIEMIKDFMREDCIKLFHNGEIK